MFARVLSEYGIKLTRIPIEPEKSLREHAWSVEELGPFLVNVAQQAVQSREVFHKYGIRYVFNQYFIKVLCTSSLTLILDGSVMT